MTTVAAKCTTTARCTVQQFKSGRLDVVAVISDKETAAVEMTAKTPCRLVDGKFIGVSCR